MDLGKVVTDARKRQGLTQEALAEATNLSLSTIQRIEKGKVIPRTSTIQLLKEELKINLQEFNSKTEVQNEASNQTFTLMLLTLGLCFLPPLNILIPFYYWKKNKISQVLDQFGKKLLMFQTLWLIFSLLIILLVPFISYILTGQTAYGHVNYPFITFVFLSVCNMMCILFLYWNMEKSSILDLNL